jgi:hypothetical protein
LSKPQPHFPRKIKIGIKNLSLFSLYFTHNLLLWNFIAIKNKLFFANQLIKGGGVRRNLKIRITEVNVTALLN